MSLDTRFMPSRLVFPGGRVDREDRTAPTLSDLHPGTRKALELRAEHPALRGDQIDWFGAPSGCFAFRRSPGGLACALNASRNAAQRTGLQQVAG